MKNTYKENNFIFTVVSNETLEELKNIPVEKIMISEKTLKQIKDILKMKEYSNEELLGLRNTIVKEMPDNTIDDWTRISMIITVIDLEKIERNMAI